MDNKWEIPVFDDMPGANSTAIDYKLLRNKPKSNSSFFALTVNTTSGATADGTPRDVNLPSSDGLEVLNTGITLLVGLGTMTSTISRSSTINPSGNTFSVKAGKVVKINMTSSSATSTVEINISGSNRYMRGTNNILTTANPEFIFLTTTDSTFTIQYATSASDRPNFGILIEIP